MALYEFLRNLRIGASLRAQSVQPDSSTMNTDVASRQLARAALWLTPRVVDGFDPADFQNLTPQQHQRLIDKVADFQAIAGEVPSNAPATREQFQKGLAAFNDVLAILQPYLDDPEGAKVLSILMHMDLPDFVLGVHCESDEDSSGDIVLDILLIVSDTAVKSSDFWKTIDELRDAIDAKLRSENIQQWWHIDVRTASEHLEWLVAND